MTGDKKRWSDLTETQRKLVVAGGMAELVVTAIAARDLARRHRTEVRGGSKVTWAAAFVVQPLGPIAYLLFGRQQGRDEALTGSGEGLDEGTGQPR